MCVTYSMPVMRWMCVMPVLRISARFILICRKWSECYDSKAMVEEGYF